MSKCALEASYCIFPQQGEDSFAVRTKAQKSILCVADGCGGLGSRRYDKLNAHTGAYLAAKLAVNAFTGWAEEQAALPRSAPEGRALCTELEGDLQEVLQAFARRNCEDGEGTRIVGSMQRLLPTTLSAVIAQRRPDAGTDCFFLWAGDSRGYVLDGGGLHQCTRDDLRGDPDALESLYRDVPLSNLLSADQPVRLNLRLLSTQAPCLLICATDGAYGCLPTPMEFEMLLLSTMLAADCVENWQEKLEIALSKLAHDDATVLGALCGFESYQQMKQLLAPRREALRRAFITPVRKSGQSLELARERWGEYRKGYDWGLRHENR
ncbi:MAG: protein phosphatase 2C domain-containing protein [Clostridia bacterium]